MAAAYRNPPFHLSPSILVHLKLQHLLGIAGGIDYELYGIVVEHFFYLCGLKHFQAMDILLILLVICLFACVCIAIAVLTIRKERRDARSQCESSVTISQITVNCDADGNVTVVTDDPSKVRVERRS